MNAPRLAADYFDGVSGRAQPVMAWVEAGRLYWVAEDSSPRAVAASSAVWPERQRHGQRHVQLPDGGVLVFVDAPAFDAWADATGKVDAGVVRWQQSWRLTALALVLLAACLVVLWRWGIPAAADATVARLPEVVEAEIGHRTLTYVDREWLKPSQLDARAQAAVLQRKLRPYRRLQLRVRHRMNGSFGEHQAILDALRAADTDAAVNAVRGHVLVQGERFADLMDRHSA